MPFEGARGSRGRGIRKNIAVTLFKSDKTPGRGYRLVGAGPVAFSDCDGSASSASITVRAAVFSDGFPVGYVFPRMSVTNVTGNTMEEVRLKFVRCELK